MHIVIDILLLPIFLITLFLLFIFSRHDFAIMRRNITMPQIFDHVLIGVVVGAFLGRIFYIFNSGSLYLFNILAFFHIVKNSGFSIVGFFIGLLITCIFLFRKSKILIRMIDIIMLSFFPLVLLNGVSMKFVISNPFINGGVVIILFSMYGLLIYLNRRGKVKDGIAASILFALICILTIITGIHSSKTLISVLNFAQIIGIIGLVSSIISFVYFQFILKKK